MKKCLFVALIAVFVLALSVPALAGQGYLKNGNTFSGTAEQWAMQKFGYTEAQAHAYLGIYVHDHLVMKWNDEWNRGNAEGWTDSDGYDAWLNNQWNGMFPGGSGETWHYKIVWTVPPGELWGQFKYVMSHGTAGGEHIMDVLLRPAGYGAY